MRMRRFEVTPYGERYFNFDRETPRPTTSQGTSGTGLGIAIVEFFGRPFFRCTYLLNEMAEKVSTDDPLVLGKERL